MSLHESDALPKEKFLLCRPQGGLNDTLCQIELCWRYAARFNRTLIIDARKSGLHADFSEFFQQKKASNKILLDVSSEMFDFLNRTRMLSRRNSRQNSRSRFSNVVDAKLGDEEHGCSAHV